MGRKTPYFLFLDENREAAKQECFDAGLGSSIGTVGKLLGAKWKALSEEERNTYKDRCVALNEAAAAEETEPQGDDEPEAATHKGDTATAELPATLPLSKVKKIIRLDEEVRMIGNDAARLITKATELFIESLTEQAAHVTWSKKRKIILNSDIERIACNQRRLKFAARALYPDAELDYDRPQLAFTERDQAHAGRKSKPVSRSSKSSNANALKGVRTISSFFGGVTTVQDAEGEYVAGITTEGEMAEQVELDEDMLDADMQNADAAGAEEEMDAEVETVPEALEAVC